MTGATSPIRLRTLGALEVTGPAPKALATLINQPKRAALLVYLAVAGPRGVQRRDTLLALLWPESDQVHARHALSQLVYQLRRALGTEAIHSHGDDAVSVDGVWCDVAAFEAALADNRPEDALELYRGDFLAGFFVPDAAAELDEWIAAERTRLRAAAAGAAWMLAQREERARNAAGAAHWAHRAVSLAPDDERGVAELVRLLGRLGDRAGALRTYDAFVRRLKDEFGIEPSAELRAVAAELRRPPQGEAAVEPPAALALAALPTTPAAPVPAVSRPARRAVWIGGVAVIIGLGGVVLSQSRGASSTPVLAVGAITNLGDSGAAEPVVVDLLATSLARLPGVHVLATARLYEVQAQLRAGADAPATLHDAARAAGARQIIQGTLHRTAEGVRLDLQRIDLRAGAVRGGYRVEGPDLFAAVDRATSAIAGDLRAPAPGAPVAEVTTHSLIAYRFYEAGLRAFYEGDGVAARRLFTSALEEDSTFAMAAYWVWLMHGRPDNESLERAARLADHATDRERLLIHGRVAQSRLEPKARAYAETLAVRYPTDLDGQMMLSESRSLAGDFLGAIAPLRQVIVLDSLSFTGRPARCRACDAYVRIVDYYVNADSLPAALLVAREWGARQPASGNPWNAALKIFEHESRDDSALAAYDVIDSLLPGTVAQEPLRVRLAIRRGDYADADQRLRRLLRERSWADAEWFLAISLRNQGRLREAAALPVARVPALQGILLLERGRWREAAAVFERQAQPWDPAAPIVGHQAKNLAFNLTHVATSVAAGGDTGRLARLADSIAWAGNNSVWAREAHLARYVRGLLLTARGQLGLAAAEYQASILSWNMGYTRANYALAEVLLRLDRPRDAIAALQPAFRGSLEAANLYLSRTELHELLARAFDAAGQPDSATAHWRQVEAAWRGADPQFAARWAAARQRLTQPGDAGR